MSSKKIAEVARNSAGSAIKGVHLLQKKIDKLIALKGWCRTGRKFQAAQHYMYDQGWIDAR